MRMRIIICTLTSRDLGRCLATCIHTITTTYRYTSSIMSGVGDDDQTGSYSIFFAEGETLAKQKQFTKAVESFTKASHC